MTILSHVFGNITDLHLSVLEKIIRPVLVYFAIVIMLRVFGKRQLAQLNPFDLTVLLCLSNTLQNAIIGDDNSVSGGIIGAVSLLAINYAVVRFFFGHRNLDQIAAGEPTVLIEQGKLVQSNLAKELMTVGDLTIAAHRQGFRTLDELDRCVLEPGGVFSMTPKEVKEESKHYKEVICRLDKLAAQVTALNQKLGSRS